MNTAGLFEMLNTREDAERVQKLLLYAASPVIKGAKPAVLLCVPSGGGADFDGRERAKETVRAETGLCLKTLSYTETSERLLIYDAKLLSRALRNKKAAGILRRYGYSGNDADSHLDYLSARFKTEKCPHEIGLFLGYPPEDVDGFIEHKGSNFLLCGSWKVYGNVDYAKRKWNEWAKAREAMASLLLNGVPCHTAVKLI
jgi:hypothetical protein